jgi:hypothetical protein
VKKKDLNERAARAAQAEGFGKWYLDSTELEYETLGDGPEAMAEWAAWVRPRVQRRRLLQLPHADCLSETHPRRGWLQGTDGADIRMKWGYRMGSCSCLHDALTELPDVDAKKVIERCNALHRNVLQRARRTLKKPKPVPVAQETPAAPQTATVQRPGTSTKARRQANRGRLDPLSWRAFKNEQGSSARGIADRKF